MEKLRKDNTPWLTSKVLSMSDVFWTYLAPKFLVSIRDSFKVWKLKRYKMRKIKESKLQEHTEYYMEFNVVINDSNNTHTVGPFNIMIPAQGAFFAKRKLLTHIKEVVDIDVTYFHRVDDETASENSEGI